MNREPAGSFRPAPPAAPSGSGPVRASYW